MFSRALLLGVVLLLAVLLLAVLLLVALLLVASLLVELLLAKEEVRGGGSMRKLPLCIETGRRGRRWSRFA
jgi:hypothetical protein